MEIGINSVKIQNKLQTYNYDVLAKILDIQKARNDEEMPQASIDESEKGKTKAPVDRWTWRHMTNVVFEEMVICTCGNESPQHVDVVRKVQDNTIEEKDRPLIARKELDILQDKCHSDTAAILKYFCTDFPGAQFSRDYYLDRIKSFLKGNKTDGGMLAYYVFPNYTP